MEGLALKLTMEKGPREGETLDCRSGSVIRIGRVVRGNTFSIKDAGISSKHLVIDFKDGKWTVSDLETSNGTFLNDVKISPSMPFHLKDGDVIKIGECTSMKVRIEDQTKEEDMNCNKNGRKASVKVEVVEGFNAGNVENRLRRNPRRGAASKRNVALKEEPAESALASVSEVPNVSEKPRGRRELQRKNKIPLNQHAESVGELHKIYESLDLDREKCQDPGDSAPFEEKHRPQVVRKRNRALKEVEPSNSVSAASLVQKIPENRSPYLENLRDPRKVAPVEQNQTDRTSPADPSLFVPALESQVIPKGSNLGKENCEESLKVSAVQEISGHVKDGLDLENMTLGDWFDYLEVQLPKQIHEITEEIISDIRNRAKQINEFVSQQQNGKGKPPVV